MNWIAWLWVLVAALVSALGILYIKYLTISTQWIYLVLIMALGFLLLFSYYQAFKQTNTGTSYALVKALAIILVLLGSYFFFHERYKVINWIGVAVIITGIILVSI